MGEALLAVTGIGKSYPGVHALDDVSLELRAGEVHALVGENGAGKSTLIKILCGAEQPNSGQLLVRGEPARFSGPGDARRAGVVTIFQELSTQPYLSVADNVVLGAEPTRPGNVLNRQKADDIARKALERVGGGSLPLRRKAGRLTTGQRQILEIARAIALDARVVIMDEPTASLPASDAERLLQTIDELRRSGCAILFVSHRLEEVRAIADRITVLRNGRRVGTGTPAEMSVDRMLELMVGRSMDDFFPWEARDLGDVVLDVEGLTRPPAFSDVSFQVRAGEILGVYGLVGAGRSEVMRAIVGADRLTAGTISLNGRVRDLRTPRHAVNAGVCYLPEERKADGLVLSASGRENMAMATWSAMSRLGFIRRNAFKARTDKLADELEIRGNINAPVATLSGGNQQKVVIGRWLARRPSVMILDEPTRGIDVGAKVQVYRHVQRLAAAGTAVIFVTSELPEVMHLSDRALVMAAGRVITELDRDELDEQRILAAAFAGGSASDPGAVTPR
ncbi:MAG: rhamnose transport system ATP-binding protein [Solirubrobacteraceae bacterium]|nr:rhamnose transport system ATP-binding protein [Solirubrobacteraceae bacterium]